ncbi:MAG: hypothetical protein LIP08_15010 [Bacteroides sp.]|nr:hypothetical protein [Bacteroides sp.]
MANSERQPKAPSHPLSININRLRYYLLAPDEAILFDWLVVKQISFKYVDFHYSQLRIERETRIKRSRLESILTRFARDGFLATEVRTNPTTKGQVRYFRVSLCRLADAILLGKYIKPGSELMTHVLDYLCYHTIRQQMAWMKEEGLVDGEHPDFEEMRRHVEKMRPFYNRIYQGYLHYRDLLLRRPDSPRELLALFRQEKLPSHGDHLYLLALFARKYSTQEITAIVQNYFSAIYHEEIRPADMLGYLLYFVPADRMFPTAQIYLNCKSSVISLLEIIRERPLE